MPEYLQGAVERITYLAEDTGYTVARLSARGNYGKPVTIIGPMAAVQPGETQYPPSAHPGQPCSRNIHAPVNSN